MAGAAAAAAALSACNGGGTTRDQIKIVGSSTVYPFTSAVAESFVNSRGLKPPVIESTGTGAGVKLFCGGIGPGHPDVLNASRRLKPREYAACRASGVADILEVQVGTDGVVLAESNAGPRMRVTRRDLYRALAARIDGVPNRSRTWREVNPALPPIPIQIYGPPATSGTRDAFAELVMVPACEAEHHAAAALKDRDPDAFADLCTRFRDDGGYVDKGENDNLIVQSLTTNPNAVGIFGYSYLEENADRLHGVPLEGVAPTYQAIADGRYPGARPLYIYVKAAHLRAVPGLREFVRDYAAAWNPGGPLVRRGLIAASAGVRARSAEIVATGRPLDPGTLR